MLWFFVIARNFKKFSWQSIMRNLICKASIVKFFFMLDYRFASVGRLLSQQTLHFVRNDGSGGRKDAGFSPHNASMLI